MERYDWLGVPLYHRLAVIITLKASSYQKMAARFVDVSESEIDQ